MSVNTGVVSVIVTIVVGGPKIRSGGPKLGTSNAPCIEPVNFDETKLTDYVRNM